MPGWMILLIEKNPSEEIAQVIDAVMKTCPVAALASTTRATIACIGSVSTSAITERKKRAKKSTAASKNAHAQTSRLLARSTPGWPSEVNCPAVTSTSFATGADYYFPIFKS